MFRKKRARLATTATPLPVATIPLRHLNIRWHPRFTPRASCCWSCLYQTFKKDGQAREFRHFILARFYVHYPMGILYHRSIVLHFKTINAWTGWYLYFLLHTTDGCSCLLLRRLPQVHLQHLVWLVGSYVGIYMGSSEDNGLGFYYVNIFCNGLSVLLSKLLFSRGSGYYERGRNYYIHC